MTIGSGVALRILAGAAVSATLLLAGVSRVSPALPAGVGIADSAEPGVCSDCQPPLKKNDGSVMGTTTTPGAITITPIYWAPPGTDFSSDPNYIGIVNQYITDLAASDGSRNSLAVTSEYTNGAGTKLSYSVTAGSPITDTNAFPVSGCSLKAGYTFCLTDGQLRTELQSLVTANNLPTGTSYLYPVFFPPGVQTSDGPTSRSCEQYNGYHSAFQLPNNAGTVVYSNEPYLACSPNGQQPNNDPTADVAVDILNHEVAESITDPLSGPGQAGYLDAKGNEIGDECNGDYGPPLGFADGDSNGNRGYNQVLNGHFYYTQREFSNAAYAANGIGKGCIQAPFTAGSTAATSLFRARSTTTATTSGPSLVQLDAAPNELPADGASTSTVTVTALNAQGEPVAGDHILVYARDDVDTAGTCGSVSSSSPTSTTVGPGHIRDVTNSDGQVVVTYTASTESADCYVLATDTEQGTTNQTLLYQGADETTAPSVTEALPASIRTGHPTTFTAQATNSSPRGIGDARFDVFFGGDNLGATGLHANQLVLLYKDAATGNRFVRVPLTGTTADDGEIDGFIVPDQAQSLPAGATIRMTFQLWVLSNVPTTAQTHSPLRIETDLDQFNPADGSQSNLDYAGPDEVNVTR